MRTLLYIALLLGLTQCLNPNPHTKRNLNRYFFLIDTLEDNHPAWLTDHIFIDYEKYRDGYNTDTNIVWISYCMFFKNNTFHFSSYGKYKPSNSGSITQTEMKRILDSIKIKHIEFGHRYKRLDSVAQLKGLGGIYAIHNDTIKTHTYGGSATHTLLTGEYAITGGILSINHKEKSIEQVKFGIYPKTVAQNIAWGQNPERRKFKGYPVTFLDSLPPLPLSQWTPFRRWKARLDSINAGLRPPEKRK